MDDTPSIDSIIGAAGAKASKFLAPHAPTIYLIIGARSPGANPFTCIPLIRHFIVLFPGTYYFYITIMMPTMGKEGYAEIMVNGRVICEASTTGAHWYEPAECRTITNLVKGDLVWVRSGSNGPYSFHRLSRFTGYAVSVQF